MAMGSAFLTQTATMQDQEQIIFHQPYYGLNEPASRPVVRVSRRNGKQRSGDDVTLFPDSTADHRIEYHYGRDGVKWLGSDTLTSAYLMSANRASRMSLLGAAPTETDIPLGVSLPEQDELVFSLPDKRAFSDYRYVWLIDYHRHAYTNLLDEDYTVALPAGNYDRRFALRIGGYPLTNAQGKRQYVVFVYGEQLHIHGLVPGDFISVYAPTGQLVTNAVSSGTTFTTPLPVESGYVVRVNDNTQKVVR